MRTDTGDTYAWLMLALSLVLAAAASYWAAAVAFAAVLLVFSIVTSFTARVFRWPAEKMALPLAHRLPVGRSRTGALAGLAVCLTVMIFSVIFLHDYSQTGIRRLGQDLARVKERTGIVGVKADEYLAEGLGAKRLQQWNRWLWQQDMRQDDTRRWLRPDSPAIPAVLFGLAGRAAEMRDRLEERLFPGARRAWFGYCWWFLTAVMAPTCAVTFFVTLFQLSIRRLFRMPSGWSRGMASLAAFGFLFCLMAAFYLFPHVSHPYHTPGISIWLAAGLYITAGSVCCGVARISHRSMFALPEAAAVPAAAQLA